MKIDLIKLIENEDGTADCELELDEAGKLYLIQLGFNTLLTKAIESYKADEHEKDQDKF